MTLKIGIACYPTYGGSGVLATELGVALAEKGHEIHFLSYEPPIRLAGFHGNVIYHEVGVRDYPLFKYPPYALALATKMAEVADEHGLDLLHVHYAVPHAVSAYLAKEMVDSCGMKIVATLHGTDITIVGNDPSYKRVIRFSLEHCDGVTAVSKYLEDETRTAIETDVPIDVIPNFVDLTRFVVEPCPEARALKEPGEKLVVHVSNFRAVKRVPDLVIAFSRVARDLNARLLLVGDGPDRGAAAGLVRELGLAERVTFLGPQDRVESILPCADVFALPSMYESFGLAALEAMACGVPVVASNAGGIPEVVEHEVTGALAPVGDVDGLARALEYVLSDEDRRREMGRASRERAERLYSLDRILPLYEEFYDRVMQS